MIEILYREKDIVVCKKPVGVLSQGDLGDRANMVSLLKEQIGEEIYPINRLDREVGGIVVYALSKNACAALNRQITDKTFIKEYKAVVCGLPEENEGELIDLLFKDSRKNKVYAVKRKRKGVKEASLYYWVEKTFEYEGETLSLLKIRLNTGRTHQIRVQFASRGMPLFGDRRYGAKTGSNPALFAYKIKFIHPETKEIKEFSLQPEFIFE